MSEQNIHAQKAAQDPRPMPEGPGGSEIENPFAGLVAEMEQRREEILAAAADGSGVQPWERDWPLGNFDLHAHVACGWDAEPMLLGHLVTMANWALRSSQGRQALLQDEQSTNPWQHTLDTVREFRNALVYRQRELIERRQEDEHWMRNWPLGDFDLFEHLVTSADFKPDWFTTAELMEMAEWALCAPEAKEMIWQQEGAVPRHGDVLEVIETVREALAVLRRRHVIEQARKSLAAGSDLLKELEQRFSASSDLSGG